MSQIFRSHLLFGLESIKNYYIQPRAWRKRHGCDRVRGKKSGDDGAWGDRTGTGTALLRQITPSIFLPTTISPGNLLQYGAIQMLKAYCRRRALHRCWWTLKVCPPSPERVGAAKTAPPRKLNSLYVCQFVHTVLVITYSSTGYEEEVQQIAQLPHKERGETLSQIYHGFLNAFMRLGIGEDACITYSRCGRIKLCT